MLFNSNIKENIIEGINSIINMNDSTWNNIDINIKLKLIHHYCNIFNKNINNYDFLSIPLKSIKPKKLIEFAGFNKKINNELFNEYRKSIIDFTKKFRIECHSLKYNTIINLENNYYLDLLNNYNLIVYNFLIKNYKNITAKNLFYKLSKKVCAKTREYFPRAFFKKIRRIILQNRTLKNIYIIYSGSGFNYIHMMISCLVDS
jgi:hypothetical protein